MCDFSRLINQAFAEDENTNVQPEPATTVKSEILAILGRNNRMNTAGLASSIGVPQATIRRSLRELGSKVRVVSRNRVGNIVELAA